MATRFGDRLVEIVRRLGNAVCVGVDPRFESLPPEFRDRPEAEAIGAWSLALVEAVAGLVPVVKFQAAFFEACGPAGMFALEQALARARALGLVAILDGKRNDIGSTAEAYARAYLTASAWQADALTINPWLGSDGVIPFRDEAERHGNGLFALVRTSNPSAGEFQDLIVDGRPLYRHVAEAVVRWNEPTRGDYGYGSVGAVIGATRPAELAELRAALPGVWLLVPGYGAQGGGAADVAAAFDTDGLGALINNSRGIMLAYRRPDLRERHGDDWRAATRAAVAEMIAGLEAARAT